MFMPTYTSHAAIVKKASVNFHVTVQTQDAIFKLTFSDNSFKFVMGKMNPLTKAKIH